MVEDLASGWSEVEARRRWRGRIRAARHTAMRWHNLQIRQGIIPSGPIRPATGARDGDLGGAGAHSSASSNAPPLYRSQPPAKAKSPGGKGFPLDRSQTPAKSKGTGGKGRGKGSQSAGEGGKKGAHPGRGEHSRYAGYSEGIPMALHLLLSSRTASLRAMPRELLPKDHPLLLVAQMSRADQSPPRGTCPRQSEAASAQMRSRRNVG